MERKNLMQLWFGKANDFEVRMGLKLNTAVHNCTNFKALPVQISSKRSYLTWHKA